MDSKLNKNTSLSGIKIYAKYESLLKAIFVLLPKSPECVIGCDTVTTKIKTFALITDRIKCGVITVINTPRLLSEGDFTIETTLNVINASFTPKCACMVRARKILFWLMRVIWVPLYSSDLFTPCMHASTTQLHARTNWVLHQIFMRAWTEKYKSEKSAHTHIGVHEALVLVHTEHERQPHITTTMDVTDTCRIQ